ncbi:cell division protein ZapE [Ferrimonas sediminicola]|uniref:Cell division protein ZapE n=1 Tax=Ferrimonas sediminicola TaxID=2569538 RepID=A0A4U1BKA7_9GAMM|nr:cell division protein ZapE [Ferrimonas sediminicola]TKB51254.1 cell division protein ZapE [Ferrimonas sediminicola]
MPQATPLERYQADLQRADFHEDPAQKQAVEHLQSLYEKLIERRQASRPGLLSRLLGRSALPVPVQGLYFWGGVGRGKTYLVDTFYEALPIERKLRIHFHRFMHRVHRELDRAKGQANPLEAVAAALAAEAEVICFDEFFVSDITDAMLLAGLLRALFERGVVLVATSNIPPVDLYRNGLQRARFLPAIDLIETHCRVVNVDHGIDYRLRALEQAEIFHHPLDEAAEANLHLYFEQLAPEPGRIGGTIEVEGRFIPVRREADGVVLADFLALCDGPRSQVDYMELARCYHTVLMSGVTAMGAQLTGDDIARRFLALVDEFYERGVKLIISCEVPLQAIYAGGGLEFEFRRCLSRLQEMQSHDYLARPHLP